MQRDTTEYHAKRANKLSAMIDAAEQRPVELLKQFGFHVSWLEKYSGLADDIDTLVRFPENW